MTDRFLFIEGILANERSDSRAYRCGEYPR